MLRPAEGAFARDVNGCPGKVLAATCERARALLESPKGRKLTAPACLRAKEVALRPDPALRDSCQMLAAMMPCGNKVLPNTIEPTVPAFLSTCVSQLSSQGAGSKGATERWCGFVGPTQEAQRELDFDLRAVSLAQRLAEDLRACLLHA